VEFNGLVLEVNSGTEVETCYVLEGNHEPLSQVESEILGFGRQLHLLASAVYAFGVLNDIAPSTSGEVEVSRVLIQDLGVNGKLKCVSKHDIECNI